MPNASNAMKRLVVLVGLSVLAGGIAACGPEQRPLSSGQPMTPPRTDGDDPRVPFYQDNFARVSQGGRYFVWYGCARCHTDPAPPSLDLGDRTWRHGARFADVYAYIAHGHAGRPPYDATIPVETLWQITAYVRSLPDVEPRERRRQSADVRGEPQGDTWSGPLR